MIYEIRMKSLCHVWVVFGGFTKENGWKSAPLPCLRAYVMQQNRKVLSCTYATFGIQQVIWVGPLEKKFWGCLDKFNKNRQWRKKKKIQDKWAHSRCLFSSPINYVSAAISGPHQICSSPKGMDAHEMASMLITFTGTKRMDAHGMASMLSLQSLGNTLLPILPVPILPNSFLSLNISNVQIPIL